MIMFVNPFRAIMSVLRGLEKILGTFWRHDLDFYPDFTYGNENNDVINCETAND